MLHMPQRCKRRQAARGDSNGVQLMQLGCCIRCTPSLSPPAAWRRSRRCGTCSKRTAPACSPRSPAGPASARTPAGPSNSHFCNGNPDACKSLLQRFRSKGEGAREREREQGSARKGKRRTITTAGIQPFLVQTALYWYLMLSKNCTKIKYLLHICTANCTNLTVLLTPPLPSCTHTRAFPDATVTE